MPTTAKICGLTTAATLDAAVAGGASHVGLVFFSPSPRDIDPDEAASLAQRLPRHVAAVGVFVDPDEALLARTAPFLRAIQLHKTAPERAADIGQRSGREVWAAVPVRTRTDLAAAATYLGAADRILYDAKPPEDAVLPGGLGLRFDWRLLDGFRHPLPWALSGGLDSDNVAEAIGITGARLVDVSSGVESASGTKDVDKIGRFLQSVARS